MLVITSLTAHKSAHSMLKSIVKQNWFTTAIGVCLILGAVGNLGVCLITGGDLMDCAQQQAAQVLAGVGMIFAKDVVPGLPGANDTNTGDNNSPLN